MYWRKHPEGNYENFYEATGYGTGPGLGVWNCRHQFFMYDPDMGNPFDEYDSEENQKAYDLTQQQRYNERMIREWTKKNNQLLKDSDGFLKRNYGREKVYLEKVNNTKSNLAMARANYFTKYDANHHFWDKVPTKKGYDDIAVHSDGKKAIISLKGEDLILSPNTFFNEYYSQSYDWKNTSNKKIRLMACSAGKYEDGFAQQLANLTNKEVLAPTETLCANSSGDLLIADNETLQEFFGAGYKIKSTGKWKKFKPINKND